MIQKPDEKRRIVRRTYNMADVRLREIFNIPVNEMILDFVYNGSESAMVLTTLIDWNEGQGDK